MFKSILSLLERDWQAWRRVWVLRLVVMVVIAAAVVAWFYATDPDGGADTKLRIQFLSWAFVVVGPAYLISRVLGGSARSHDLLHEAFRYGAHDRNRVAMAIYLGHMAARVVIYVALLMLCVSSRAEAPPAAALPLLPVLSQEAKAYWPDMPDRPTLGAQVEQETCASLKSRWCWSTHAELFTYEELRAGKRREYGFGLGQITMTAAFDNFAAARGLDPSLRAWAFDDRYDAAKQLRTMVLMDRANYRSLRLVVDPAARLAMAYAAYNGGLGGVNSDRRLCAQVAGCDPQRWFGHVEKHSLKQRAVAKGYGRSFFDVNREYVVNVMRVRRVRYEGGVL